MIARQPRTQQSIAGPLSNVSTGQPFWADDTQVTELQAAGMAVLVPAGTVAPSPEPPYAGNGVPGLGVGTANSGP
jgi:hypothetical protein